MSKEGQDLLKRADAGFEQQQQHLNIWKESMSYCLPRKQWVFKGYNNNQPYIPDAKLQNSVAMKALRDLASGMLSAFMNPSEIWAQWEPSDDLPARNEKEVKAWYSNATVVGMRAFSASGLYDSMNEALLDAGATGTTFVSIEGQVPGTNSPLNFKTWDVGSYAIGENSAGVVDRVWRETDLTVDQAMQQWPDYRPERWTKLSPDQRINKTETFVWEIIPREEELVGMNPGPTGMPYKGTVVERNSNDVVWEGGWPEFPGSCYRFLRQSGTNPWGTGPGIEALPDCRGTNFLDTAVADGFGKMVDPPMAVKDDMRGVLDFRMGGVSAVSDMSQMPQPLFTPGQGIQAANEFLDRKKAEIGQHFFKDLFTPFLNDPRTLKAAQVYEMKSDLLAVFAPFGHRFLAFVSMFLERCFMVLLRQGLFGPIPRGAFAIDGRGRPKFLYPKVTHQSRMALELQNLAKQNLRQILADMNPVWAVAPGEIQRMNWGQIIKLLGGNSPVLPDIIRTDEEFAQIQAAMQAAAQQQQQQEMLAQFATKNPQYAAAALGGGLPQ